MKIKIAITAVVITLLALPALSSAVTTTTKQSTQSKTKKSATITSSMLTLGKVPGVEFRGDVTFLPPDRDEKLDVYLPAKREPGKLYPAILMIHGGGWVGGNKTARREMIMGSAFAKSGYIAVSVEYEKTRGKAWPTNLHDCKNAVRWIRTHAAELQVDPDHIGVIGGSAGGHLSLMVGYTSGVPELEPSVPYPNTTSTVQCCVDLYGITNLLTRHKVKKDGTPIRDQFASAAIMAKTREEDSAAWKLASPVYHITSQTIPTLILHGTADKTVDREQAIELDKKLTEAGVEHELIMLQGAGHSFVPGDKNLPRDIWPDLMAFFDKHLKH